MVTRPEVHPPETTVGELRSFFEDDHMHMALLADGAELVGTVERGDLRVDVEDRAPAYEVARLDGRTIEADASLAGARHAMKRAGRRRLAVTSDDSTLLGLLCLKGTGEGFCSDEDVAARRLSSRKP
jgi:CBS domain-containing protein